MSGDAMRALSVFLLYSSGMEMVLLLVGVEAKSSAVCSARMDPHGDSSASLNSKVGKCIGGETTRRFDTRHAIYLRGRSYAVSFECNGATTVSRDILKI